LEVSLISASQFLEPVVPLLLQIGLLLHLCLVEAVDNGVFALRDKNALDFAGVLEADLADFHAAILFEVGPWCVDDCDIILLVALGGG
jgi:hypothetical protein